MDNASWSTLWGTIWESISYDEKKPSLKIPLEIIAIAQEKYAEI